MHNNNNEIFHYYYYYFYFIKISFINFPYNIIVHGKNSKLLTTTNIQISRSLFIIRYYFNGGIITVITIFEKEIIIDVKQFSFLFKGNENDFKRNKIF